MFRHACYSIAVFGLERLHPSGGPKYRRIDKALNKRGLRRLNDHARSGQVTC
jgi:hypothetical protein